MGYDSAAEFPSDAELLDRAHGIHQQKEAIGRGGNVSATESASAAEFVSLGTDILMVEKALGRRKSQ